MARLVALLHVRTPASDSPDRPFASTPIRFGAQLPVEHQARQAIMAGVDEVFILADAPDTELTRLADRISRETETPVSLAADGLSLARLLKPGDDLLMIGERMIVPMEGLIALAEIATPAVLVTQSLAATAMLERIDGDHVWAGAARFSSAVLHDTVDMLGEWDLMLTLLRRTIQLGAERLEIEADLVADGQLTLLRDQADSDRALHALVAGPDETTRGFAGLLGPLERPLLVEMARRHVDPSRLDLAAGVAAVAAAAAVAIGWALVALILALLGSALLHLRARSGAVLLRRPPRTWLRVLVEGAGLTVLAVIGERLAEGSALALAGVVLPVALIGLGRIAEHQAPAFDDSAPAWTAWAKLTTPLALCTMLVALLVGMSIEAFIFIALSAFGTVAVRLLAGQEKRI